MEVLFQIDQSYQWPPQAFYMVAPQQQSEHPQPYQQGQNPYQQPYFFQQQQHHFQQS